MKNAVYWIALQDILGYGAKEVIEILENFDDVKDVFDKSTTRKDLFFLNDNKYKTYQRGTIIKADFGIGIGSEMSQVHFAIVINNYDNPKSNVLTVIPLTSKENRFNLNLGTLIIDLLTEKVKKELKPIKENEINKRNNDATELVKLKKIDTLLSYYKSYIKKTYACCNLITTISKERIFPPINEYDIIGKARCSNEILNDIDKEIKKNFTLTIPQK